MDYVLDARPIAVSATGMSHVHGQPENIAFLTLFFRDTLIGHLHLNWISPVKVRRTLIGASQKMIVYDDMELAEKVRVYDKGIHVAPSLESLYQINVSYRTGDMWASNAPVTAGLQVEAEHVIDCIENGTPPITGAPAGLRVVRILEAASESLKRHPRRTRERQSARMIPLPDHLVHLSAHPLVLFRRDGPELHFDGSRLPKSTCLPAQPRAWTSQEPPR